MTARSWKVLPFALVTFGLAWHVEAAGPVGPPAAALQQSRAKPIEFLRNTQAEAGSWSSPTQPGIAALVTTALLHSGVSPDDPTVAKALKHLQTFIQKDGGIYYEKSNHRNYESSIRLLAFQAAN